MKIRLKTRELSVITSDGLELSASEAENNGYTLGSYCDSISLAADAFIGGASKRERATIVGGISSTYGVAKKKVRSDISSKCIESSEWMNSVRPDSIFD